MAVSVGEMIPDVEIQVVGDDGQPEPKQIGEVLGSGKVVLFAVPGAFTPGCTLVHLPGFVAGADELAKKGVDTVACISVNDAFVMAAWGQAHGSSDIVLIADGNGTFTEQMGLTLDASGFGMGVRSQRYAAVIQDGVIETLVVDEGGSVDVSSCEAVLGRL